MENKNLGKEAKCKVTGFTGIIISVVYYLNGCVQYCVKPPINKDGEMPDGEYIDIDEVEIISDGIKIKAKPGGGPQRDCPKH